MNRVLNVYQKCSRFPFGKELFSKLICFKAPYFRTIKPVFTKLEPGFGEIAIKNKRRVRNHINSVHAIAMCNMCELVAGSMLESTIPSHLRWIPKEMRVEYLKVARTDLTASCKLGEIKWLDSMELPLTVDVVDTNGVVVLRAIINMYVSLKNKKSSST
jgi:acyl-coenzyme A thioesterase PaaI-like protein